MKKIYAGIFISLMMIFLLTGCSGEIVQGTTEPDTDTQMQVHTLQSGQKVVYRFHWEKPGRDNPQLILNFLDENTDAGAEPKNWLRAHIGSASGPLSRSSSPFFIKEKIGTDSEAWVLSDGEASWKLFVPDSFSSVKRADMELTISRKDNAIQATLDIDGARAWSAAQTIENLDEDCYFYLSVKNAALSSISYSETGITLWVPGGWVTAVLLLGFILVLFILHKLAKNFGSDEVFLVDGGLAFATGAWVLSLVLFVSMILIGKGVPISHNFYFLPVALPGSGIAYWIVTVIAFLAALGLTIFIIYLAIDDMENPLKYLFWSLLLGACHALWYVSAAFLFMILLHKIIQLIAVFALIFLGGALMDKLDVVPVWKTTRVYNRSTGETLYEETTIDYTVVEKDDKTKN